MTQYSRQSKSSPDDFVALTQAVRDLRQQLVQPANTLFDTSELAQPIIGLQKALQTFDRHEDWQQLEQALQRIESVVHLLNCPILGVAGLLNSGKSSFVASYLSAQGRQRILRGDTSNCGTQRFVFWLPEAWRHNAALWSDILAEISGLFAGHYEMLSDDPEQARQQYNQLNADQFDVPLIATDPGLLNLALLDCPDVQRSDDDMSSAKREAFLSQAAPICSAFLFVTTQKNIADEKARKVASSLRDKMPDVPFHLVMNQVEADADYPAHQFLRDKYIKPLLDLFRIDHFYIAYHYKILGWEQQTPAALHYLIQTEDKTNQVPAAWQVLPEARKNHIQYIQPERFLINLPDQLKLGELGLPQILSHWHRFQTQQHQALINLRHHIQQEQSTVQTLHQQLLDFCHQNTTDDANNPRLPLSPELIKKLHQGMEAAAPGYLRPLLLSGRKVQQFVTGSVDAVKKMLAKIRLIDQKALYSLKSQALNAEHLSELMREEANRAALKKYVAQATRAELTQTWGRVLTKTDLSAARLADDLDDQVIADSAAEAWKKMPLQKKAMPIVQGVLALSISLLFVLLVPLGSAAAVVVAQASLPELIAAAGLGGLSGWGFASTSLAKNLEQELFMPYFSDFFHFSCDAFALPRKVSDQPDKIPLHNRQYALRESSQPIEQASSWCQPPRYWRENSENLLALEQTVQDIDRLLLEKA